MHHFKRHLFAGSAAPLINLPSLPDNRVTVWGAAGDAIVLEGEGHVVANVNIREAGGAGVRIHRGASVTMHDVEVYGCDSSGFITEPGGELKGSELRSGFNRGHGYDISADSDTDLGSIGAKANQRSGVKITPPEKR